MHLATWIHHLATREPEKHNTEVTFLAGLVLSDASLLSSPSFYTTSRICRIWIFLG